MRNWRNGSTLPSHDDLQFILDALFADDPALEAARDKMQEAWTAADAERGAARPTGGEYAPTPAPIRRPDRWFGRGTEVDDLTKALVERGERAVLVMGPGGIGKTELTKRVATEAAVVARFARRAFVPLETANTATDMAAVIATALGVDPSVPFDAALARLRGAPVLLVLDNLETPVQGDAEAVEVLLGRLAGETEAVLLGSIRGEHAPMEPAWTEYRVQGLSEADGAALFRSIATLVPENDPHLLPLVRDELAGMPLAIRLVALRARGLRSLAGLWEDWQQLGVGLAVDPSREEGRLTSVSQSIRFSLDAKPVKAGAQRLFAMLGQLPAGLTRKDRDALLGTAGRDAQEQLLGVGLAFSDETGRIDLLPPVRDFGRREAPSTGKDARAWAAHFLAVTAREDERAWMQAGAQVIARLAPELPNIEAAAAACGALGLAAEGSAAAWSLYQLLLRTGRTGEALLPIAAACRGAGDRIGEAHCLFGLADIARERSDHEEARRRYAAAMPICQAAGARIGEAHCLFGLADIARARSEHEEARRGYASAMPIYRTSEYSIGEAHCLFGLAEIARARSEHEAARGGYEEALPIYRAVGERIGEANCIRGLADIARARSEHEAARRGYESALPIYRGVGARVGEALCGLGLARVVLAEGRVDGARAGMTGALAQFRAIHSVWNEADALQALGDLERAVGDTAAAMARYRESDDAFLRIGNDVKAAESRERRAVLGG